MWNAISKLFKDEREETRARTINDVYADMCREQQKYREETIRQMMAVDDMSELECLRLIAKAAVKYMRS